MATKLKMCGTICRHYCIVCLVLLAFHAKLQLCETNTTTASPTTYATAENNTTSVANQTTDGVTGSEEVTTEPETITEQVSHDTDYQSTEPNVRKSDHDAGDKQEMFLKLIFDKYGKDGTISYEGFEHLMVSLGLGNIRIAHTLDDHWSRGLFKEFHEDHTHALSSGENNEDHDHDNDHDHASHEHGSHDHNGHNHEEHEHGSNNGDYEYSFLSGLFDNDLTTASPSGTKDTPKKQRHKKIKNAKLKPERSAFKQLRPDGVTTTGSSTRHDVTTSTETSTKGSQDTEYSKVGICKHYVILCCRKC
jgi:hypothetical protein